MKRFMLLLCMCCVLFLVAGKQSSASLAHEQPDFCYTGWEITNLPDGGTFECCSMLSECWLNP